MEKKQIVQLGSRIDKTLHLRLKLFCVENDTEMQQFVAEAIKEKLERELTSRKKK